MQSLKEKLTQDLNEAAWDLLAPHNQRGVVFCLKKPNDLVQVGMLIADNKANLIKGLMDAGEMYRPSKEEIEIWKNNPSSLFQFLIIDPFVLIQPTHQ